MVRHFLSLLRLHQWVKNTFIFLPLFFGGKLFDFWTGWLPSLIAFVAYGFAASAIYCFNDIHDAESDRLHQEKRKRPIASGAVSPIQAYTLMGVSIISAFAMLGFGWVLGAIGTQEVLGATGLIALYLVMNVAYCLRLKHIAVIDVFIIATGFVLRIFVGGQTTGIELSQWIVLMTFLLALFLALAKRRDDAVTYEGTGVKARPNVNRYSVVFLNQCISIVATMTMMCYIMYTVSEEVTARLGSRYLYVTAIFVLLGFMRYLQLTIVDASSGNPSKLLLSNRFLQCCVVGWILTFAFFLYF